MQESETARKRWELENGITETSDQIFKHDEAQQRKELDTRPWLKDLHYFKKVKISSVALLKMVMHARAGGQYEIMGLMMGKIIGDTFVVMDSFALPVKGTETRVNAGFEANEYMIAYLELIKQVGRLENAIGWYHSHPGYGCWLSGIDVSTQLMYQKYQEPWLAVVVDPTRTVSAGKVEIGAFRTYPEGSKPPNQGPSDYQTIPMHKIQDFGVHCKAYYPLSISYFKSSLDSRMLELLWNKYWANTLSSSPMIANRGYHAGQISDLAEKLDSAETQVTHGSRSLLSQYLKSDEKKEDSALAKVVKDGVKLTTEQTHGMMSQVMKHLLFNNVGSS